MIIAVIPAAGMSRRMGTPKLALDVGGRMLIEHVVAVLREGGVSATVVVLGPHVAFLEGPARAAGAEVVVLDAPTEQMRDTILAGLANAERRYAPTGDDAFLLVPADHPALDADVVRELIRVADAEKEATVVVPTYRGERGHPALVRWAHVAGMRAHPPGEGLNTYLRKHAATTRQVETASPGVVRDMDTPGDYARLVRATKPGA